MHETEYRHRVAGRVHTTTLAEVQPGDVFFTTFDPSTVWTRRAVTPDDEYAFLVLGDDTWFRMDYVGQPETTVVVIHNTRTADKAAGG